MELKIEERAFLKLKWLRDYKPYEIAVLGQTLPEDPLHVIDVHIVKQTVDAVAADMDIDYVCKFVDDMLWNNGVLPINCERVWMHTHPMTGAGSADPSSKDMNTWNDKDNSMKNLFVMFILSKSGEMTCKIKVKCQPTASGLSEIDYIADIPVKIISSEENKSFINEKLKEIWGERAFNAFGQTLISKTDIGELYPEFSSLEDDYKRLVTRKEIYSIQNTSHGIGFNTSKKNPKIEDVPIILKRIGRDRKNIKNITILPYDVTKDFNIGTFELDSLIDSFYQNRNTPNGSDFIKGLIAVDIISQNKINTYANKVENFLSVSQMIYPEFIEFAEIFNAAV